MLKLKYKLRYKLEGSDFLMKKILSVLITMSMIVGLVVYPVMALDSNTTTASAVNVKNKNEVKKETKNIEKALKKAQEQLKKALSEQSKLQSTILKAIEKAKSNEGKSKQNKDKQITNSNTLLEKWQVELDKAAAHDKIEMDHLNADIAKWTEMNNKQIATLKQHILAIDAQLIKQLAELDKKLVLAKDDATKANIAIAKANVTKYANDRKAAINVYLTKLQVLAADRQKLWDARRELLTRRQAMDIEFRTAMVNVKKAELNDKLAVLSQTPPNPSTDIENKVRIKFQKTSDALNTKIKTLQALILDLQSKLNK